MFIKTDKKTGLETMMSSEDMVDILKADVKEKLIDEVLTDIVTGDYEHSNAVARYKYRAVK